METQLENRYKLYRPTASELRSFIRTNDVDKNEYRKDEYDCDDFTSDLVNAAMNKGMFAGCVYIEFMDQGAHALAAFKTLNNGVYFVEPQNDAVFPKDELQTGDAYWNTVEKFCDVDYVENPKFIVEEIDIIW